jgi:hypothetical protein
MLHLHKTRRLFLPKVLTGTVGIATARQESV